jgi:hypothetical protein
MVGSGCLRSLCRNMSLKLLSKTANLRSGARLFSTSCLRSADYTHAVCLPYTCRGKDDKLTLKISR